MSVLIKGMKMPTCCDECAFVRTVGLDRWKCELSGCSFNSWDVGWGDGTENKYIRHSSCPLVEVPAPHGRLIDADALIADIKRQCREVFRVDAVSPDDFWITRNEAYNERLWGTWCESFFGYLQTRTTIIEEEEA